MLLAVLLALASLSVPQAERGDPVARWNFDGDAKDSGPATLPTRIAGRLEFIDSPVSPSGKMAVFNGVDSFVQVDPSGKLGAGSDDFSLSAWVFALDRRGGPLFSRKGWSLTLLEGGVIKLATDAGTFATPAGAAPAAQWIHIVVSVKRGTEGKLSRIMINGETSASGDLGAVDLDPPQSPLFMGKALEEGKFFAGFLDEVRLYSRALEGGEAAKLTDDGIAWIRPKAHAKTPFAGKFELVQDDVVVFAGGENMRVGQDLGHLETLLSIHAAGKRVHFRSMAWEGDTVYEQPRPLNFGPWTDQLRRTGATVLFVQFGQIESLEGKAGVERFTAAYESLLAQFAQSTKRMVLVSPTPFGKAGLRQPDLAARNEDLKLYIDAIRKLAAKNGFLFIDLSTKVMAEEGFTRDGLHLTTAGQWRAAQETARQLEVAGFSDLDNPNALGVFPRESYEKLRSGIRVKNALWNDSWRPANWAFLSGDRMEQPSSRDHLDRRIRWFPVEVQQLPALVRRGEEKIETLLLPEKK